MIVAHGDHLVQWADYSRLIKKADDLGLSKLTEFMQSQELEPARAVDVYLLSLYSELARKAFQDNEYLLTFTRAQHENIRDKYKQYDRDFLDLNQTKIAHQLNNTYVPIGNGRGPVREWTEYSLLEREFNKSRRHIPIRRLLERAGEAIKALKPVFMMSPMSVAQFLEPGQHEFDVVIMDEASQIQPHEALGAIARAKQMIIVGDSKQLPPTTFFDTTQNNIDDDQREETLMDDTESILDIASTAHFPSKRLKWHYRSEHESLIAFSNAHWYDNELIVFPSPISTKNRLGITFNYIDNGVYGSGKNEIEADRVAQRVVEHAQKYPELSLGVGALNIRQKTLIEDRLEQMVKNNRSAELAIKQLMEGNNTNEPLFIKNLENLQGDERDVIIISCTYGPDQNGTVYQRFGPINGVNGPKRLNVLFTRAKKRMEIFCSMHPEQITVGYNSSPGAIAFRRYLSYAKTGTLEDYGVETGKEPDSEFEVSVIRVLRDIGYEAVPQVGVAGYYVDIGVVHPNRPGEYILGVECDGAMYHSSRIARDRDRLREEVLIKLGWNIYRIWSTEWFKNRKPTIENLSNTLKSLVEKDKHVIHQEYEIAEPVFRPEALYKPRQSDDDLFRRLLMFKMANIPNHEQDSSDCILRDEMLQTFVKFRPTTRSDFIDRFSTGLRDCTPFLGPL
jgi:very-short-patch-repair endonuclease